ncbi:MAG TPA: copper transporter [Solirubrobacterales bacterium]
MGYSARYHATSLIAVFVALAIGVVIGAALGGDTLTDTRKDLERSLTGNLEDARERADQLSAELGYSNEFAERVYPVLARDRLQGMRIGIVALGGLSGGVSAAIEETLEPTGGRLVAVGVVREPVDLRGLAGELSSSRFANLAQDPEAQAEFGVGVGRQLVLGGGLLERVRSQLFSRASGNFRLLDGVIVVRSQPQDMGQVQRSTASRIESGLAQGIVATRATAVGVEPIGAEPSSISFFQGNDLTSIDHVDLVAGRLATVLALRGAEGSFGVKGSADSLLPDLLGPAPARR